MDQAKNPHNGNCSRVDDENGAKTIADELLIVAVSDKEFVEMMCRVEIQVYAVLFRNECAQRSNQDHREHEKKATSSYRGATGGLSSRASGI